jgi:hypothetical protein
MMLRHRQRRKHELITKDSFNISIRPLHLRKADIQSADQPENSRALSRITFFGAIQDYRHLDYSYQPLSVGTFTMKHHLKPWKCIYSFHSISSSSMTLEQKNENGVEASFI